MVFSDVKCSAPSNTPWALWFRMFQWRFIFHTEIKFKVLILGRKLTWRDIFRNREYELIDISLHLYLLFERLTNSFLGRKNRINCHPKCTLELWIMDLGHSKSDYVFWNSHTKILSKSLQIRSTCLYCWKSTKRRVTECAHFDLIRTKRLLVGSNTQLSFCALVIRL